MLASCTAESKGPAANPCSVLASCRLRLDLWLLLMLFPDLCEGLQVRIKSSKGLGLFRANVFLLGKRL